MITSVIAYDYGRVLYDEKIDKDTVKKAMELLKNNELVTALDNPAISNSEKHNVIDRLFPNEIKSFIKYISDNKHISLMKDIYNVYKDIRLEAQNGIRAEYICVTEPDNNEIDRIKNMIKKRYNKDKVILKVIKEPQLIGGFILKVGDYEYDRSLKGSINNLRKKLEWR